MRKDPENSTIPSATDMLWDFLSVSELGEKDALSPQGNAEGVSVNPDFPRLRIHCIDYLEGL